MPTRIVVIGSTGSIGRQTLQVVEALNEEFQVIGLAAGYNLNLLAAQVERHRPTLLSAATGPAELAARLGPLATGTTFVSAEEMATCPEADVVVVATTGKAGLAPSLAAVRAGKRLALANKEVLVMAGALMQREHACCTGRVHPVDSEHSALWQCLQGEGNYLPAGQRGELAGLCDVPPVVRRLILTASGGAFRDHSLEQLRKVTAAEALRHPTWLMGPRVTIDSATMINKGLEVIEAHWLFGVPYDRIEVVIHRECVIHSFVEFLDRSVKAQMGVTDMRLPIQYALTHPRRCDGGLPGLDFSQIGQMTVAPVDAERYPGLGLAVEAGRRGGTYPAVLAASDEVAVELFLSGAIAFPDIVRIVDGALQAHDPVGQPEMADILAADEWARRIARQIAGV